MWAETGESVALAMSRRISNGSPASRRAATRPLLSDASSKPTKRAVTPSRESSGGKKARAGKARTAAATAAAEAMRMAIDYRTIRMNGLISRQRIRVFARGSVTTWV